MLTRYLGQFIVMFRSRFNEIMPAKLPNFGPQDVENGVVDPNPTTEMQQLLCALLGLVLNRKKPPEYVDETRGACGGEQYGQSTS